MNRGSHSIMKPVEGCHIRVLYTQTNKGLKELTEVAGRTETASLFQAAGAGINLSCDLGACCLLNQRGALDHTCIYKAGEVLHVLNVSQYDYTCSYE